MFNWLNKKDVIKEKPPYIGMAIFTTYTSCMGLGTTFMSPDDTLMHAPGFGSRDFFEFTVEEVQEKRKTESKIKNAWLNNEDILFYEDINNRDDRYIFINKMSKKYELCNFGDIHRLYDHGLSINGWGDNNFYDKELEKKINDDMDKIIKKKGS